MKNLERSAVKFILGHNCAPDFSLDTVLGTLQGGNAGQRALATFLLGLMGEKRAVGPLLNQLGSTRKKRDTITALGLLGDERAIETLDELLDESDEELRTLALRALYHLGDQTLTNRYERLCQEGSFYVSHWAEKNLERASNGTLPFLEREKKSVLIVDDTPMIVDLLILLFSSRGVELDDARDGLEAVVLAERFRYDLILMGIGMPRMGGIDAIRIIHERHPDVPIVAMSGYTTRRISENAFKAGARGFLHNPFTNKAVLDLADRFLLDA